MRIVVKLVLMAAFSSTLLVNAKESEEMRLRLQKFMPKSSTVPSRYFSGNDLLEKTRKPDGFTINKRLGDELYHLLDTEEVYKALCELVGFCNGEHPSFEWTQLGPKQENFIFAIDDDLYVYKLATKVALRLTRDGRGASLATFADDESFFCFIREDDLWICDLKTSKVYALTKNGDSIHKNGVHNWVYEEEIYGRGEPTAYKVSPKKNQIAYLASDESRVQEVTLVDHNQIPPTATKLRYPKAGSKNPEVRLALVSPRGGKSTFVSLGIHENSDILITGFDFTPCGSELIYQVQDRIQSKLWLYAYNIANATSRLLHSEQNPTWVSRLQNAPHWLTPTTGLWLSEKSGFCHLYKLDLAKPPTHNLDRLTSGDWDVLSIAHADEKRVVFTSNEASLLEDRSYQLDLSTLKIIPLDGTGFHTEVSYSKDGKQVLRRRSHLTKQTKLQLLSNEEGEQGKTLDLSTDPREDDADGPEIQYVTYHTRNSVELTGQLLLPKKMDPNRKYPLIVYTYGGPKNQAVRNRMTPFYGWHSMMTEQGFIVWICDPASAQSRGRREVSRVYGNLGIEELLDIAEGVEHLKSTLPALDGDRVGIWGWSFGGFLAAKALGEHPLFKVAVAVAPVTDWKMYDSVYTERFMGLPETNAAGYEVSRVHMNDFTTGNLLLVHGTLDDNVHDQNSLVLFDETARGVLPTQMLHYINSNHGLNPKVMLHLYTTMASFFKDRL